MHHKQRVEEINVKVEALTKDLISQKIFEEMEDVLMWEDLPDEVNLTMNLKLTADRFKESKVTIVILESHYLPPTGV